MTKGTGSLALILHAHLPFVRHPEHEFFREENWLFEAISESYVPLLQMIRRLLRRGVRVKLTLSVSPTLCAMLADPLLRDRYIRHLDLLIALAERECERNRQSGPLPIHRSDSIPSHSAGGVSVQYVSA